MPDSTPPPVEFEAETTGSATSAEVRTIFLGGLLLLGVLAVCYIAAEIVLPIILAFVLGATFQPVLRFLLRLGLPHVLAAMIIVLGLISLIAIVGLLLAGPLAQLISQMPQTLPTMQERLNFLNAPMRSIGKALEHVQSLGPGTGPPQPVAVQGPTLPEKVLQQVRVVGEGAFATLLVLFFVLIAGDQFLRRLVEILPGFKEKRKAVEISQQIEHDISIYLATITVMNFLVGLATAGMAWLTGLGSPLLMGYGGVPAQLRAYPRADRRGHHFPGRGHRHDRAALGRVLAGAVVFPDPLRRRRDNHTDAAGRSLHGEPGAGHDRGDFLVLDVGRCRRGTGDADASGLQDHLRPHRDAATTWAFHRRRPGLGARAVDQGRRAKTSRSRTVMSAVANRDAMAVEK